MGPTSLPASQVADDQNSLQIKHLLSKPHFDFQFHVFALENHTQYHDVANTDQVLFLNLSITGCYNPVGQTISVVNN